MGMGETMHPADPRSPESPEDAADADPANTDAVAAPPTAPVPPVPPTVAPPTVAPPPERPGWSRRKKILAWVAGGLAVVLVVVVTGGYLVYRHLNANLHQVDVSGLLGSRPVDLHPTAQNIL